MKHRSWSFFSLLVICAITLGFTRMMIASVSADNCGASGTPSDDHITCNGSSTGDISTSGGNDTVTVKNGGETGDINTGGDNDQVTVKGSSTVDGDIKTGNGDDSVTIRDGSDVNGDINGGNGNDTVSVYHDGVDSVNGGDDDDTILVHEAGAGTLNGADGNDTIILRRAGADSIKGGDGDDSITLRQAGADTILAGDGNDTVDINKAGVDYIDGGQNDDSITVGRYAGVEGIDGGQGNDTITIKGSVYALSAGQGDDHVIIGGYNGSETYLNGNGGTDTLTFKVKDASARERLQNRIGGAASAGGVIYKGQLFLWKNFEALDFLLRFIAEHGGSDDDVTVLVARDARLNSEAVAGPIAIYCTAGRVEVWLVDPADGHGELVLSALESELPQSASGVSVALIGDQVTSTYGDYSFSFAASLCPG